MSRGQVQVHRQMMPGRGNRHRRARGLDLWCVVTPDGPPPWPSRTYAAEMERSGVRMVGAW